MAKKAVDAEKKAKPKDKFKVEFTENFNGALNDRYFSKIKKGDVIEITAAELQWLNSKGVIRG